MAKITGSQNEKIFTIQKWLGLNENPDGDTKLKMGEAAEMCNWKITRDGNLKKRPGMKSVTDTSATKPHGLWSGYVNGTKYVIGAWGTHLYKLWDGSFLSTPVSIGTVADSEVTMFGFDDKLYVLDGTSYRCWDGITFATVTGYIPVVAVGIDGDGHSQLLEQVNKLSKYRRVFISTDGEATVFQLPEKNLQTIDSVTDRTTGSAVTGWTGDLTEGTVTFSAALPLDNNRYEIKYSVANDFSSEVYGMKYFELFNGTTDTRVFLYGDGSNECLYSDIDYDGKARADYFPDLNEMAVGDSNTPITNLIRHYSRMVAHKSESAWMVSQGTKTLDDGRTIVCFYANPVNKSIGCSYPGSAQLVLNAPWTIFNGDIYEWRSNTSGTSSLSIDERQAKRMSDRVYNTLHKFYGHDLLCYDSNSTQEYFVVDRDTHEALVCNYAANAWYYYDNFNVTHFLSLDDEVYCQKSDGKLYHFSDLYLNEDGTDYSSPTCKWVSGSMNFGADYMRKYSALVWITLKPENKAMLKISAQTDKSSAEAAEPVTMHLATLAHANFGRWSFMTNYKPQVDRLKIKVKKFTHYKLVLESNEESTPATVLCADIKVRYTGIAK